MIVIDMPETHYSYRRNLRGSDVPALIEVLETIDAQAIVGYLAGRLQAARGIWAHIGNYRLANGSFIDPSDLMLYVQSYYKPADEGPVEALELNYGPAALEGSAHAATVDELLDALAQLDFVENAEAEADTAAECIGAEAEAKIETGIGAENAAAEAKDAEVEAGIEVEGAAAEAKGDSRDDVRGAAEIEAETESENSAFEAAPALGRLANIKVIMPSAAPEMHKALVGGWRAMYYEALDAPPLLVFG